MLARPVRLRGIAGGCQSCSLLLLAVSADQNCIFIYNRTLLVCLKACAQDCMWPCPQCVCVCVCVCVTDNERLRYHVSVHALPVILSLDPPTLLTLIKCLVVTPSAQANGECTFPSTRTSCFYNTDAHLQRRCTCIYCDRNRLAVYALFVYALVGRCRCAWGDRCCHACGNKSNTPDCSANRSVTCGASLTAGSRA